jgi:hypothetical protein
MTMISSLNPDTLRCPETPVEIKLAKSFAALQINLITEEIRRLVKLKKAWARRLALANSKSGDDHGGRSVECLPEVPDEGTGSESFATAEAQG